MARLNILDNNFDSPNAKQQYLDDFLYRYSVNKIKEDYSYSKIYKAIKYGINNKGIQVSDYSLSFTEFENEYKIIIRDGINKNIKYSNEKIKLYKDSFKLEDFNIIVKNNSLRLLNDAFNPLSLTFEVANNTNLGKPIIISYDIKNENILLMPNINFVLGQNATLQIIQLDINKYNIIKNFNLNIVCSKDSKFNYNLIQKSTDVNFNNIKIISKDNCSVDINTLTTDCELIKNDLSIVIDGSDVVANINGLYNTKNENHINNDIKVFHLKPNSKSNQLYKGIISENSTGIFNGKIIVDKIAQKTNALQLSKVLVLSKNGSSKNRPQLEIFADDVKCSHGATTGKIDSNQLLYLTSRGISEKKAKKMIIDGFIKELKDIMINNSNKYYNDVKNLENTINSII